MTKEAGVSLADLDLCAASDQPFEFEYLKSGQPTGVFLSVLGSNAEKVTAESNRLINERRKAAQYAEAKNRGARNPDNIITIESDIAFGQRLAAVRLVGWRGITEPFTPELGLKLCRINADATAQIIERSDDMGNFTKASPTT